MRDEAGETRGDGEQRAGPFRRVRAVGPRREGQALREEGQREQADHAGH